MGTSKTKNKSHKKSKKLYSPIEWETRIALSALYRGIAHYGMSDLVNGAIAARIPDQPDCYLTNPYGMYWEEATASSFIKIDSSGRPTDSNAPKLNDGAINLCLWIFGARPETMFYVHGHDEEIMAVGSIKDGLLPLNQPAVYLEHLLGYIEYEFDEDEMFGTHFVKTLSTHQILISRNHGYYCLGTTAAEAFFRSYFLRQSCSAQIKTLSMGRELNLLEQQKVARYRDQMYASEHYNYDGATEWPGLIRMLERTQPDYKL